MTGTVIVPRALVRLIGAGICARALSARSAKADPVADFYRGKSISIGRAIAAEPGIPPERAAALRTAFMATMQDAEFVTDARKRRAAQRRRTAEIIASAVATPAELIQQAKRYIAP
jgi:hypothetical protein